MAESCSRCGEPIGEDTVICPDCGTRQSDDSYDPSSSKYADDEEIKKKQKIAEWPTYVLILISVLLPPVAYWMVDRKLLAVISMFSLNFFLLGWFIVPIHVYSIHSSARKEIDESEFYY